MRSREIYPVENIEAIHGLAPAFSYDALTTWFRNLEPSGHMYPRTKSVALDETSQRNSDVVYRNRPGSFLHTLTASLSIKPIDDEPSSRIILRGRAWQGDMYKDENGHWRCSDEYTNMDLLSELPLAWRRGVGGSLDLIPEGYSVSSVRYEPTIITVEKSGLTTPAAAEQAVLKAGTLISGADI